MKPSAKTKADQSTTTLVIAVKPSDWQTSPAVQIPIIKQNLIAPPKREMMTVVHLALDSAELFDRITQFRQSLTLNRSINH